MVIILVYVDDILVVGNQLQLIDSFFSSLNSLFALKDLGNLSYFLGVELQWSADSLYSCQAKYFRDLLLRVDMSSAKPLNTPMAADPDWASCPDDRWSTSGYCVFFGTNLISWSSAKQKVVSQPSVESEYCGMSNAIVELIWLQSLLTELKATPPLVPLLLCDNVSATYLAANPVFHNRSKHIEIDHHFIRERVARRQLIVRFVPSEDQLADIMTKPLPTACFYNLRTKLTVFPRPISLAKG